MTHTQKICSPLGKDQMIRLLRSTIFFQGSGYLLQFGALLIFARILGSEGQGILSMFRVLGQVIVSFMWVGLPSGIVYFVGKDRSYFLSLLKNCLKWFAFVFPILILFLCIIPIDNMPKINLIKQYIPYLLAFVFLLSFFNLFQGLMLSLKKYLYYNLFAFGLGSLIFCGSVSASLVSYDFGKLKFAVMTYVIGYGIMFVYGFWLTLFVRYKLKHKISKSLNFLAQFKVGFRGYISNLAALLLFRLDLFLVAYFLSFKEVGIYSIALFSAELITKIPEWSASILKPMVASAEEGHVRRTLYLFYSAILIAVILGILFLSGIMLFPSFISNLIGKDFTGVEMCLLLLLPRVIMQSGVGILAANLAGKGYPWYHPLGCIVTLSCLVVLDIILIPRLGINGAALGNSLAHISAVIVFWIGFYRYNNVTEEVSLKSYCYSLRRILDVR